MRILAALFLVIGVISIANAGIEDYSTTPSSNTALFPENMDPSDVNDNLRQVQTDIRTWYNDWWWTDRGDTPTYVSGTRLTLSGDLTADYVANMRVKVVGAGAMGTAYSSISSASHSAGTTTINLTDDVLDNTLTTLFSGIDPTNDPIPVQAVHDSGITSSDITGQSEVSFTSSDYLIYSDTSDSGNLKKDDAAGLLLLAWPVGSIYISASCSDPATRFGGTWSAFGAGKMLVSLNSGDTDFDTAEETGGAKTKTLSISEMPAHSHNVAVRLYDAGAGVTWHDYGGGVDRGSAANGVTGATSGDQHEPQSSSTGGGSAFSIMNPYIVVCMYKRTA